VPGPLFHAGAVAMCPHGGQITTISTNVRVLVNALPVATMGDQFLVAGCVFTVPPGKPQPCVRVQWLTPALRCFVDGQPAITQGSTGICFSADGIPNGPPIVVSTQPRVIGT
jgi:uncharacterized Zn-binding protein involved in type VI secretion